MLWMSIPTDRGQNIPTAIEINESQPICADLHERLRNIYIPKTFNNQVPVLIYRCGQQCGGFGDQVRGIVTTFLLALLTDRAFLIDHPHQLYKYLDFETNLNATWKYSEDDITKDLSLTLEFLIGSYPVSKYRFRTENFHETLSPGVHAMQINLPIQNYLLWNPHLEEGIRKYGLDKINYLDLTGCVLQNVLVPKDSLLAAFEAAKKYLEPFFTVGIHIDGVTDQRAFFWQCAQQAVSELSRGRETKWVLVTDSDAIRQEAIEQYRSRLFLASEFLGQYAVTPNDTLFRNILEHLILSATDKLIISRSDFGETAALRNFKGAVVDPEACQLSGSRKDFTRWWHLDSPLND